jgi:hypothetical protein
MKQQQYQKFCSLIFDIFYFMFRFSFGGADGNKKFDERPCEAAIDDVREMAGEQEGCTRGREGARRRIQIREDKIRKITDISRRRIKDKEGNRGLQKGTEVYRREQRFTKGNRGLQKGTDVYRREQRFTEGNRCLQKGTDVYRREQRFTEGNRGLQKVVKHERKVMAEGERQTRVGGGNEKQK